MTYFSPLWMAVALWSGLSSCWASEPTPAQQASAADELKKAGGKLTFDEKAPGKPLITADLSDIDVKDETLAFLDSLPSIKSLSLRHGYKVTDTGFAHLSGLTQLQSLDLWDVNKITNPAMRHLLGKSQLQTLSIPGPIGDVGLEMLKVLPQLQTLSITGGGVSDAGLVHLKGFANLKTLNFAFTRITDAGLEHLKGLTQLSVIRFGDAKVTDQGLSMLRQALPHCKISR